MGYTPYTTQIILEDDNGIPFLNRIYPDSSTILVPLGGSTQAALIPNRNYQVLMVDGNDGSYNMFTINPVTGVISTTSTTDIGTHTVYLRNTGSYHISQFDLIVTEAAVVSTGCCDRALDVKGLDYRTQAEVISGNIILSRFSERRGPLSSLDIIRMKQAMAQKR
jgi:hypothetical protein